MNEAALDRLADLLVRFGAVPRPDSHILLSFDHHATALAERVQYQAYRHGAGTVEVVYENQNMIATQLRVPAQYHQEYMPASYRVAFETLVASRGSAIQLRAEKSGPLFGPLSLPYKRWEQARMEAREPFYTLGIQRGYTPWTLTYVPTFESSTRLFPTLSPEVALARYWELVFQMTYADTSDCVERWIEHVAKLKTRRRLLDRMRITNLHFTSAAGTDLHVGLSVHARWLGGAKETRDGRSYVANIPTYEVFTTPDYRTVRGVVHITKPVPIHGVVVRDISLTFEDGVVVSSSASPKEPLQELLSSDVGARRVGEIALVGLDSPVAQTGHVFHSVLYDENAACHLALGEAYASCIQGGSEMSKDDLLRIGVNASDIHHDLMISDNTTSVVATLDDGSHEVLIEDGHWKSTFL